MTPVRTFPIRLPPLTGEALDSWLEALAHRMHTHLGDVLAGVGLASYKHRARGQTGGATDWAVLLGPGEAVGIAAATGIPPPHVEAMTLARYDGTAVRIEKAKRTVNRYQLWGRATGSRYCPECLAASGGRWPLVWRLGWCFACPVHWRLLADICPSCGRPQRQLPHPAQSIPQPGRCAWPPPGGDGPTTQRCAADLSRATTAGFPPGHPALAAQEILLEVIRTGTAAFGVYASDPQPASTALADIRALAMRFLGHATDDELAELVPADLLAAHGRASARLPKPSVHPGYMAPGNAATAAAGVTAAVTVLGAADIPAAGAVLRGCIERSLRRGAPVTPTEISSWSRRTSPVLTAVQLSALDPLIDPFLQLRYRTATSRPRYLPPGTGAAARRACHIPGLFWPALALRFAVPHCEQQYLRRGLPCAVLTAGTSLPLYDAPGRLGAIINRSSVSQLLGTLQASPHWEQICAAIIAVADYLDTHGSPIDYRRRRKLKYDSLLPDAAWFGLCRRNGVPTGNRKAAVARSQLFERLSGLPVSQAPFANGYSDLRDVVGSFPAYLTPELAAGLHDAALEFLHGHHVRDEPVSWHPPLSLLSGLELPGPDPESIDVTKVHQSMLRHDRARLWVKLRATAEELGTTMDVIRYLLEENPAPRSPRASGQVMASVRAALPPPELAELYLGQRLSLDEIGRRVGASGQTIGNLARDYGISLRKAARPRRIFVDRSWLYEQYVTRRRSLADLAREAGMSTKTMKLWAARHNIALRPDGAGTISYPPHLRTARQVAALPAILLPAMRGCGWQRLQRFAAAAIYPGIRAAAEGLGLSRETLIIQINRLERDLGGQLLVRAKRGQPMTLTAFGAEVVSAVARTQELTAAGLGEAMEA